MAKYGTTERLVCRAFESIMSFSFTTTLLTVKLLHNNDNNIGDKQSDDVEIHNSYITGHDAATGKNRKGKIFFYYYYSVTFTVKKESETL